MERKKYLTKVKEGANCRRVSVQRYSVQYKGYNLIGFTTVEGDATRGIVWDYWKPYYKRFHSIH
jgi:hypothetical protein